MINKSFLCPQAKSYNPHPPTTSYSYNPIVTSNLCLSKGNTAFFDNYKSNNNQNLSVPIRAISNRTTLYTSNSTPLWNKYIPSVKSHTVSKANNTLVFASNSNKRYSNKTSDSNNKKDNTNSNSNSNSSNSSNSNSNNTTKTTKEISGFTRLRKRLVRYIILGSIVLLVGVGIWFMEREGRRKRVNIEPHELVAHNWEVPLRNRLLYLYLNNSIESI